MLLHLLDLQVQFLGEGLARKGLSRTACYFAKFLPEFDGFRRAVHGVRNLREFKSLVLDHFR